MSDIRIDPRKQFSKRLARWTAWFWFLFMTWLSILLLLVPDAGLYAVYMGIIATAVMILNVWAYTRNSIYEKGVFAMLDKTKIELSMGTKQKKETTEENTEDEPEQEGGGGDG